MLVKGSLMSNDTADSQVTVHIERTQNSGSWYVHRFCYPHSSLCVQLLLLLLVEAKRRQVGDLCAPRKNDQHCASCAELPAGYNVDRVGGLFGPAIGQGLCGCPSHLCTALHNTHHTCLNLLRLGWRDWMGA